MLLLPTVILPCAQPCPAVQYAHATHTPTGVTLTVLQQTHVYDRVCMTCVRTQQGTIGWDTYNQQPTHT